MLKTTVLALAIGLAVSAAAQAPARPDPADPKAPVPTPSQESAFKGYRLYVDPDVAGWRHSNAEVGRLGGHMGHPPKSPGATAKPAGKPPVQGGHGGHK